MKNNIAAGLAVSPHILKRLMERDMGAAMYMVIGMMVGSLYAIVVGPTTLKVPQPAMTFADFSIVWFIIGAAAVLALCVCSLTMSLTDRLKSMTAFFGSHCLSVFFQ